MNSTSQSNKRDVSPCQQFKYWLCFLLACLFCTWLVLFTFTSLLYTQTLDIDVYNTVKSRFLVHVLISYNDIFRNLLGIKRGDSISAAFVNARMDNFNMLRRKSVYNFIVRLSKSTNVVVTSILQSVYFVHRSHLLHEWKETLLRTQ